MAFGIFLAAALGTANPACGVGLVAGTMVCITWEMKRSEHEALLLAARNGDAEAAAKLAHFYDWMDTPPPDDPHKWYVLAAERGACSAIVHLLDEAKEKSQPRRVAKWKTRARWNKCSANPPVPMP